MNLNFSHKPEYELNRSMIREVIDLYGILIKFLVVEKINYDKTIFGDFSHLKTDKEKIYEMYALPENSESFDTESYNFDAFGFTSYENITLYIAKNDFDNICEMKKIVGNLIVLPNNKVMEVSNIDWMPVGVNNLFTNNDEKSVYKLTCVPYEFKLINEVENQDLINSLDVVDANATVIKTPSPLYKETNNIIISDKDEAELEEIERQNYDALNGYFDTLLKEKDDQDNEAEVIASVKTTEVGVDVDKTVNKPIVNTDEKDIWNGF